MDITGSAIKICEGKPWTGYSCGFQYIKILNLYKEVQVTAMYDSISRLRAA